MDLASVLLSDIQTEVAYLEALESPMPIHGQVASFHH